MLFAASQMKEEQSAVTTKEMQDAHQPGRSYECCEPSKAVFHLD